MPTPRGARRATARDLQLFQHPWLWLEYPWLRVVRRTHVPGLGQRGLMYDARGLSAVYGYSATVFLADPLALPRTEAEFLALPRRVYDSCDELADAGWVVDPNHGA